MWLSQRRGGMEKKDGGAQVGTVTLAGNPAGVNLGGERRDLPVFAPGGYLWKPAAGQQVLVMKAGDDGELACVAGARSSPSNLSPGDIYLYAGDGMASIWIRQGGVIQMNGYVFVNGVLVGVPPENSY